MSHFYSCVKKQISNKRYEAKCSWTPVIIFICKKLCVSIFVGTVWERTGCDVCQAHKPLALIVYIQTSIYPILVFIYFNLVYFLSLEIRFTGVLSHFLQ